MGDGGELDPRAKWRVLPTSPRPEDWVTELDTDPVPGSVQSAHATRKLREALEYG